MIELTRDYALAREQFGQPLAQFQAVKHQLAEPRDRHRAVPRRSAGTRPTRSTTCRDEAARAAAIAKAHVTERRDGRRRAAPSSSTAASASPGSATSRSGSSARSSTAPSSARPICTASAAPRSGAGRPWTSATAPSTRPSAPSCARSCARPGRCAAPRPRCRRRASRSALPRARARARLRLPRHPARATAARSSPPTRSATRSCSRSSRRAARPASLPSVGPGDARADAARVRQRGAEASASSRRRCAGEIRWCQGYSEPGAGSDLASLQSRADARGRRVGDPRPQDLDQPRAPTPTGCSACSAPSPTRRSTRASPTCSSPMKQPGIDVRPLHQMTGGAEFNEVFFDGARTPAENLVGQRGEGWKVSRATLVHERNLIGNPNFMREQFEALVELARRAQRGGRPAARGRRRARSASPRSRARLLAQEYTNLRLLTASARRRARQGDAADADDQALLDEPDHGADAARRRPDRRRRRWSSRAPRRRQGYDIPKLTASGLASPVRCSRSRPRSRAAPRTSSATSSASAGSGCRATCVPGADAACACW